QCSPSFAASVVVPAPSIPSITMKRPKLMGRPVPPVRRGGKENERFLSGAVPGGRAGLGVRERGEARVGACLGMRDGRGRNATTMAAGMAPPRSDDYLAEPRAAAHIARRASTQTAPGSRGRAPFRLRRIESPAERPVERRTLRREA